MIFDESPKQNIPKKKRKTIPKPVRERVWRSVYGTSLDGICTICNFNVISAFNFHVSHIIAVSKNGTDADDNLYPTCATCNLSMQSENLHHFYNRIWSM